MWRGGNFRQLMRLWPGRDRPMYGLYVFAALLVVAPWFHSGYILALDMVFTPRLQMPASINNTYLFRVGLHLLNSLVPSDVIEKFLLFAILWLAGVGLYRLARMLSAPQKVTGYQQFGWYVGGLFYMINPFTYDRFMTGQYLVVFGYALLPWFMRALFQFLQRPAWRTSLRLSVWAVIISLVSIHAIGYMAMLTVIGLGCKFWQHRRDRAALGRLLRFSALAGASFVLASSYWLVPLTLGKGSTAATINNFGSTDQTAFATLGSNIFGRLGEVLRLQGFWAEQRSLYKLPQAHVHFWGLLALMLGGLVVTGAISFWRARQRLVVACLGLSAVSAIILAIGVLNHWLTAYVPFFAGYREPEKFVAVLALVYGVLLARGVTVTAGYFRVQGGKALFGVMGVVLLALPLVWTSTMLWGFNRQLLPVQYPADWFAVNTRLEADNSNFRVLFLPWHLYMYFNFASRIIASPAPQFFGRPTVISNDPELSGVKPLPNPLADRMAAILSRAPTGTKLGTQLAPLHIKYIILAQDNDYLDYGYLNHQADLRRIHQGATLEVYRNEAMGGR